MNLTGNLKDKVEKAETMEEKKNIIADAGMELTDEKLEGVAGGAKNKIDKPGVKCNKCGKRGWYGAMCLCGGTYIDC